MKIKVSITDVRAQSDLADYTGQLQLLPKLRITDKLNGSVAGRPRDRLGPRLPRHGAVRAGADTNVGRDLLGRHHRRLGAARHDHARSSARSSQLGQVRVFDGGADGLAATPGNTLFAVQGVFVP